MSDDSSVYEDAYSIMHSKPMPIPIPTGSSNLRKLAYNPPPNIGRDEVSSNQPFFQANQQLNHNEDIKAMPSQKISPVDIEFRLNQARLQSKLPINAAPQQSPQKNPIYYKPPSMVKGSQFGIQQFLPPSISAGRTNKIPLERRKVPRGDDLAERRLIQDTEDIIQTNQPSGDWTNPIMKQALARQIDISAHMKTCLSTTLFILLGFLVRSGLSKVATLTELKSAEVVRWYNYSSVAASIILILNLSRSLFYVLKGQDQCLDLPLSNRQRQLIGLEVNSEGDEETKLMLKQRQYELDHQPLEKMPKYSKIAVNRDEVGSGVSNASSSAIELSKVAAPLTRQFLTKTQTREISVSVKEAFESNFNIDFNVN